MWQARLYSAIPGAGFFTVPVDDLYAMPVLCEAIAAKGLEDLVAAAPMLVL